MKTSGYSPPLPVTHKRRRVADSLREMIAGLSVGDRLPSITDLEKHFGVAKSTVEAAVADLQAEGLVVRRQGSGTFVTAPTTSATPTRRPRAGRMVITSIPLGGTINIFTAMTAAVEAEMRRAGFDPMLLCEMSARQRFAQIERRWEAGSIDGYIHIGSISETVEYPPVPGVIMGETMPDEAPVHMVTVDNYGGGRRAGEYLWRLGHRHVACLAAQVLTPGIPRFAGLSDVLQELGGSDVSCTSFLWRESESSDLPRLETALRSVLDATPRPTAIFFGNDQAAFPALQMLLSWGYRVPEDISVVSFDDTPGLASHTRPALTGLRMPTLALGALAVQTLCQVIEEPGLPFRRHRLPAELIIRESAGPVP